MKHMLSPERENGTHTKENGKEPTGENQERIATDSHSTLKWVLELSPDKQLKLAEASAGISSHDLTDLYQQYRVKGEVDREKIHTRLFDIQEKLSPSQQKRLAILGENLRHSRQKVRDVLDESYVFVGSGEMLPIREPDDHDALKANFDANKFNMLKKG